MVLAFASAACVAAMLFCLLLGWLAANDETSSSWADPEPRRMLHRAIAFGLGAALCAVAGFVLSRRAGRRGGAS
jgi:multisubunit Na+/H+ antiporter MnhB subunit